MVISYYLKMKSSEPLIYIKVNGMYNDMTKMGQILKSCFMST